MFHPLEAVDHQSRTTQKVKHTTIITWYKLSMEFLTEIIPNDG